VSFKGFRGFCFPHPARKGPSGTLRCPIQGNKCTAFHVSSPGRHPHHRPPLLHIGSIQARQSADRSRAENLFQQPQPRNSG
jgi:hypothetical protein